jgi:tetratricopeptide (TPR) repeat protein
VPGVDELRVERLGEDDARRLLDGLEGSRRDEVLVRAAGNPLALLELGRPAADGASGAEQAFVGRVAALPEATQTLLLLAAADSTQSLAVVGAAARELGLDATALEPAELEGLVLVAGSSLEFRHPLVRSAIYRSATFARRAAAHTALADALDGEENADRRAWHHASAVLGTDDEAAAELERTAGRARTRGGHAAASTSLERAADLTGDPSLRAHRLVAAADAAALAGDGERSQRLVDRAGDGHDDALAAQAALVRGSLALNRSTMGDAFDWFLQALTAGRTAAPGLALKAAIRAIEAAWQAGFEDRLAQVRDLARTIQPVTDDDRSAALVVDGLTAFADDDFEAAFPSLRRAAELAAASENPQTLLHAAWGAAFAGDAPTAYRLVSKGERLARSAGAIGVLSVILMSRASWELAASNFTAGEQAAAEGLTLARDVDQPGLVATHLAILARVDAVRGRADQCRERAAEAIALARERGFSHATSAADYAVGLLELGLGRPAGRGLSASARRLQGRVHRLPLRRDRRPRRGGCA